MSYSQLCGLTFILLAVVFTAAVFIHWQAALGMFIGAVLTGYAVSAYMLAEEKGEDQAQS